MKETKIITSSGLSIDFSTDEPIKGLLDIDKDAERIIIHFNNRIVFLNLKNISFIETEK